MIPTYFSQTVWVLLHCFQMLVIRYGSYPRLSGQLTLLDGMLKHQRTEVCGLLDMFIQMLWY